MVLWERNGSTVGVIFIHSLIHSCIHSFIFVNVSLIPVVLARCDKLKEINKLGKTTKFSAALDIRNVVISLQ